MNACPDVLSEHPATVLYVFLEGTLPLRRDTQIKNPDGKAIRFSERRALARRVRQISGDVRQVPGAKNLKMLKMQAEYKKGGELKII